MVMAIKSFNQRPPTLIDSGLDTPPQQCPREWMQFIVKECALIKMIRLNGWSLFALLWMELKNSTPTHSSTTSLWVSVSFCDTWYDVNERMWEWSLGIYAILQLHCVTSLLLRRGSIITWGMHLASELVNCDIVSRFSPRLSLPWSAEYQTAWRVEEFFKLWGSDRLDV